MKRKERKGKKRGILFNVYVCNACVRLATVDPIQLCHVQPNPIQPTVLWHSVKPSSAEPGIFPVFFVCVGACVLVYTERKEKKRKERKGKKIK